MSTGQDGNPFAALGLATRPDLTDDDVRAAWRRIAAATHPDRADGGDPDRFAVAAAAYTALRTRSGRGEALADLADLASGARWGGRGRITREPGATGSAPAARGGAAGEGAPTGPAPRRLLSRLRRGRVLRLALRVAIAAAISAGTAAVAGAQPATPALMVGALTWLLITARNDLAPPG